MFADIWIAVLVTVGAIAIYGGAIVLAGWIIINGIDALIYGVECLVRRCKRDAHHRAEKRRVYRA